jgi:hypothetical protein
MKPTPANVIPPWTNPSTMAIGVQIAAPATL